MKFCSYCGDPVTLRVPPGDNRERYVCSKGNSPAVMAAYNTQTGKIGAAWEALESFYGSGHIIRTDPPEGAYRPFEEIATVMFPDAL